MGKEIMIKGIKYTYLEENGKPVLLKYNSKHRMWVEIHFAKESAENSILQTLKEQFVDAYAKIS